MKKIILTLAAVAAFAFSASAQNWYYGGGARFNLNGTNTSYNSEYYTQSTNGGSFGLGVTPEIGYNLNDKFAVGGNIGLSFDVPFEKESVGTFNFSINPYFRWNFLKLSDKVKLLADAVLTLGCLKSLTQGASAEFAYGLNVLPGISYAFNSKCTLVGHFASVGFNGNTSEGFNYINYGLSAILSPSVSFYWAF